MPISDCEVRDPRIRRTRQLLQSALGTLMHSKEFDEISVQDITEQATVNRATFYDHYTDKFALLDAMVAGGFHQLLHERNVRYDGTCPSAAQAIILATCDYLSQSCTKLPLENRQTAYEPLIDAAITKAIQRVLIAGLPEKDALSDLPREMVATSTSWAIYGAVKTWIKTPERPPAEEIVPLVLRLIMPILLAAKPEAAEGKSTGGRVLRKKALSAK